MFEIRTDHAITTADGIATETDIHELHDVTGDSTGEGITVAVMDSGIDRTHPVFANTDIEEHDFSGTGDGDRVGHGTATAGLITQLAPGVKIVVLKIFGESGRTGLEPITKAYEWLLANSDRIDVVNMSWGALTTVPQIDALHQQLLDSGVQDVVSAGNTGMASGSPATSDGAFSIGAVDEDGDLTRFSSYNPWEDNPDVCAIGKNVRLARASGTSMGMVIDDEWVKASGTSFSAPIVSGLTARYMALGGMEPLIDFQYTARDIPDIPADGEGIADYDDTVNQIGKDTPKSPPNDPDSLWEVLKTFIRWIFGR